MSNPNLEKLETIGPYNDADVPAVLSRISNSDEFLSIVSGWAVPPILRKMFLGNFIAKRYMQRAFRSVSDIAGFQNLVAEYLRTLITNSCGELTFNGLDQIQAGRNYLFISNHRDIVLDSSLINYLIRESGSNTCRIAVGDNLLGNQLASDLMRLNKSFFIRRGATNRRDWYRSLEMTSSYIRDSIENQCSVWIAQRQGRAKDGFDRTEIALLKMLMLAFKKESAPLQSFLEKIHLIPVSISYELDPCAVRKARELRLIDDSGSYEKAEDEDLNSMIEGLVGYKGRVHIEFGRIDRQEVDSIEKLGEVLDRAIVGGLRVFEINEFADSFLKGESQSMVFDCGEQLKEQMDECSPLEQEYLLKQYANVCANKRELGLTGYE